MATRHHFVVIAALVSVATLPAFSQHLRPRENYVVRSAPGTPAVIEALPASSISKRPSPSVAVARPETPRLSPTVARWRAERSPSEAVIVLVTLREDGTYPTLPRLRRDRPRDSVENEIVVGQRHQLLDAFAVQREGRHRAKLARLGPHQFRLVESFAAANVLAVETTLADLDLLLTDPDVQHVEPLTNGEPPPAASDSTTKTGRTLMRSDWWISNLAGSGYRNLGWERIALLDTGVRTTHTLLSGKINFARDCVNGTSNYCQSGSNLNPGDVLNHGTASAAIMSGTSNLGDAYAGTAFYKINSYKVYNDGLLGLDYTAVQRAFLAAQANGDDVIVAEMQALATAAGAITAAAEVSATVYGIPVIAAAGNGPQGPFTDFEIRAPGNARNALGIGAFDAASGATIISFSHGPTPDGRIKPDVLFPTHIATAGVGSDTYIRRSEDNNLYGGTSCATAFAGAIAATIVNQYYDSTSPPTQIWPEPGRVYTTLLLDGVRAAFDNTNGVGRIERAQNWCEQGYTTAWGEVTLNAAGNVATIYVVENPWCDVNENQLDVVIWWSESETAPHQQMKAYLFSPAGALVESSTHATSVFQKIRHRPAGGLQAGQYRLEIYGPSTMPQNVRVHYYARETYRP